MTMPAIESDVPLAPCTTLGVGGPARYLCRPVNAHETSAAIGWARSEGMPLLALSRGSNVCISDQGWPGLVLLLTGLSTLQWNGPVAVCQSGVMLNVLVGQAVASGLAGIEKLAGIPGSVGGAVVMNAGAFGQEIADVVESVEYTDLHDGDVHTVGREQLRFAYRHSLFREIDAIILQVRCRFSEDNAAALEEVAAGIRERRRAKQPLDRPNCGSVFKNPMGQGAGRHIEAAGLKGCRRGGMSVSEKHANFIVNDGTGTARDFRELVCHVQRVVAEKTDITLQPEVLFIGSFD